MSEANATFFEVGKAYCIRGAVYHYLGRVKAVSDTEVLLEEASWLADSGRFGEMLGAKGEPAESERYPSDCVVPLASISDYTEWAHELPSKTIWV